MHCWAGISSGRGTVGGLDRGSGGIRTFMIDFAGKSAQVQILSIPEGVIDIATAREALGNVQNGSCHTHGGTVPQQPLDQAMMMQAIGKPYRSGAET